MGFLYYGASRTPIEFDDRTLAHLEAAIVTKLRRNESFVFTLDIPTANGSGRRALWFRTDMDLEFHFIGGRAPAINRHWVETLLTAANSGQGLRLSPEPAQS